MSRKYQIIFSDIDGTLLDDHHEVTPKTKAEIQRAVQLGVPFVLVSSRMPKAIITVQNMIGITGPIICYGGGLILDEKLNILYSKGISPKVALEFGQFIEKDFRQISWNMYAYHTWRCSDPKSKWVKHEEKVIGSQAISGKLEEMLSWDRIHKILCMGEPDSISFLQERLRSLFPSLFACQSSPCYLEISTVSVSKGRAIEILCDTQKIPLENSIAFGDNYNDLDMLEKAGTAYMMKNAPRELKSKFKNVTDSNNHDGIALILQREIV